MASEVKFAEDVDITSLVHPIRSLASVVVILYCISKWPGECLTLKQRNHALFALVNSFRPRHLHYLEQDIVIAAAKLTEFYRQQLSFLFTGKNLFSALKEESLLGCIKIYL